LNRANQEWAIDFVADGLATGRGLRMLTVVDSFTRECPAIEVDTGLSSPRVTRVLEWIIGQRGTPEVIRCDNVLTEKPRRICWAHLACHSLLVLPDSAARPPVKPSLRLAVLGLDRPRPRRRFCQIRGNGRQNRLVIKIDQGGSPVFHVCALTIVTQGPQLRGLDCT